MYYLLPYVRVLIVARLVVGLGTSTLSVCRTYISKSVPREQSTHHFSYLSTLQFIGFAVSPGIGSLLTLLPEYTLFSILPLNSFTYHAILLFVCCALIVVATYFLYKDPQPAPSPSPDDTNTRKKAESQQADGAAADADYLALFVYVIASMVFRGFIAELETVSIPFVMEQYGVSFTAAGPYLTAFGFVGLFVYTVFKPLAAVVSDRWIIAAGLAVIAACTAPLVCAPVSSALPLIVYVGLIGALWAIVYPIRQTGALSLFSKVIKSMPPGGLLGVFSATSSGENRTPRASSNK